MRLIVLFVAAIVVIACKDKDREPPSVTAPLPALPPTADATAIEPTVCANRHECFALGDLRYGRQEYADAVEAYAKACDYGDSKGCFNTGFVLSDERKLVVDYARGVLYFQKACDLRNYEACWNLGLGYLNGDGVERDHDKAVALLEKGCTGGQARGCLNLGIAHHDDPGHTDPVKAFDAFARSCELGDDEGCYRQARSLEHGDGTLRDTEAAAKLYKRACSAGHTLACSHTP